MFTGIRKTVVAGILAGFAALVGVGASSASGEVAPADNGIELEWGTGAAPQYVPARWTGPMVDQRRGSGPLYELRWGNGGPPVLFRIDAG